ncbi:hypothetical protein BCR43DRAFT_471873 [Syncephalastrum racemosum]|uniref:Ubiquitin carboxyl-terminal hydrolase n=1 Tax=Syncephalastrum racemosum TaxID=13706 RepID=A0A1X2HJG5_SYNRA|nr:hypothetical protein BCR43DRAFT_471873 [Syncephalastrum racemosum]
MQLEHVQSQIADLYALAQFAAAIVGLLTILIPVLRHLGCFEALAWLTHSLAIPNHVPLWVHRLVSVACDPMQLFEPAMAMADEVCLDPPQPEAVLVPGLVNTGNSCFLNAVLQSLSSLPSLHAYLQENQKDADDLPMTDALHKTIRLLAKPLYRRSSFRPYAIVRAMDGQRRVVNREQQDAQELFQLVAGRLDQEHTTHAKRAITDGMALLTKDAPSVSKIRPAVPHPIPDTPLTGLLASRLSCMECNYTEAIRHFSFNNIQLNLPNTYTATLDACLQQYISLERLDDAACRRCSMRYTQRRLTDQIERLQAKAKRTKKEIRKREILTALVELDRRCRLLENRLQTNRFQETLEEDAWLERHVSRSTKQVMFAKPPKVLCLHLIRSAFAASGALFKNQCQVLFPEVLDLAPYTTSGTLSTHPTQPMSIPTRTTKPIRYRLMSMVVHFGGHNFGHYVAFKRRIVPQRCHCQRCGSGERCETWEDDADELWYRISDTKVDLCSLDTVLQNNPYMLLYERIDEDETKSPGSGPVEQSASTTAEFADEEDKEEEEECLLTSEQSEALDIANALMMLDKDAAAGRRESLWSEDANRLPLMSY